MDSRHVYGGSKPSLIVVTATEQFLVGLPSKTCQKEVSMKSMVYQYVDLGGQDWDQAETAKWRDWIRIKWW